MVSLSVVGVVILPLLLTSTTIISKGLVDSASHSKSNFQLSEMFNQMGVVFDSSSNMVRPDNFTTWDPSQEFQITYYNANRGMAEKVGYQLLNVEGRWFLQKLVSNNGVLGNQVSSPYATLASDQVEILPPAGQTRPQFNYCNSNGTCSNDRNVLTTDFLSGLASITLEMQGVQITAPGIKQSEGRLLTGNKPFFMGKKFREQAAGDLNTASAVSVTSLTDFYGVGDQSKIKALSASLNPHSNTSLVLPATTELPVIGQAAAPQVLLNNTTILRVVVDELRGNYAFVGQKAGAINLYFYNAVKNELTLVTPNISPSGRPNTDFPADDYPLVIDEFTGKVFWTSSDKGTATNPYGKADAGAGPNKMHLLGWDPYQPTLGVFLVDSRNTNLTNIHYTLIPDHQNGTIWALQDNGLTGITGSTQIVGIDTNTMATVFNQAFNTIAGASNFDYINSWDITHGEGSRVSGDLFLAALNNNGNRMGMVYLKANRNGVNVSITSTAMTTTTGNTSAANTLIPSRLVVNDTLRTAGFLSNTGTFYSTTADMTALVEPTNSSSGSPQDPPADSLVSMQPRQTKQWFHHNFYYGIPNNAVVPRFGNGLGALWVNPINNDAPYFGGPASTMTMNVTAGTFPSFTFGNLTSQLVSGTYTVGYPATGHCFHNMGLNQSQVMTSDETVRAYSAVYTGTSTSYPSVSGADNCSTQTGYPTTQKGVMIQRNTKPSTTAGAYQDIQYFFRDMNGQDPWMMPVQQTNKVVFTYYDGTNYRLDVFTSGASNAFTTGLASARPSVPATFMQAAKEKDIIGVNAERMELIVTNADNNIVLWKFGNGRQNNAVGLNGNFLTRQAEPTRYLRLENLGLRFAWDAMSIAEDNSNAYVLLRASTRAGVSKPTRIIRFKCDPRLKEASRNNASFCYEMSVLTLPSDFPTSTTSMDLTVNQSPNSSEAFVLVNDKVYRIPDRNMIGAAPASVSTAWWDGVSIGFNGSMQGGIAHSSKTGKLYVVRSGEGAVWRAGDHSSIRGSADRSGLLVAVIKPNRVHDENILLPMEAWTVDNAFNDNAHYSGRQCGLRIDDQRGLLHVICQNNTVTTNPRNFVYTYQKPASYQL
jgi:hypothetical protein